MILIFTDIETSCLKLTLHVYFIDPVAYFHVILNICYVRHSLAKIQASDFSQIKYKAISIKSCEDQRGKRNNTKEIPKDAVFSVNLWLRAKHIGFLLMFMLEGRFLEIKQWDERDRKRGKWIDISNLSEIQTTITYFSLHIFQFLVTSTICTRPIKVHSLEQLAFKGETHLLEK